MTFTGSLFKILNAGRSFNKQQPYRQKFCTSQSCHHKNNTERQIFSMFGQLSTTFTLLSALLAASLSNGKDFDWDIEPRDGYPAVAFNDSTTTKEIIFLYDAPLLYESKTYGVTVFNADCKTIGSNAITHSEDASVDSELTVLLDVDQGTISNSTYYTSINITNAVIGLCLRVDYFFNGDSFNFHETNLTVNIDSTADFNITSLEQMRVGALRDQVNITYPVVAYHCNELSDKLVSKSNLTQGDALQVCVEIDPTIVEENVFVTDILSFDLDQANMDQNVTHKKIIDQGISDALTSKLCQGGICNMKTQLESRWFNDPIPGNINATGVALLAFGPSGSGQGVRFLRAPIVFQTRNRKLQQGDDGNAFGNFILSTSLNLPSSKEKDEKSDKLPELMFVGAAALMFVGVALLLVLFVMIRWFDCLRGRDFTTKSEPGPELDSTPTNEDAVTRNTPSDDRPAQDVDASEASSEGIKSEPGPELDSTPTNDEDTVTGTTPSDDDPAQDVDASEASSEEDDVTERGGHIIRWFLP
jgi:hypothetical protein